MNISRFFGSTNREAMRQVRLALGPDALIVSNKRVNGGVEILATDPTSAARIEAQADAPAPTAPGFAQGAAQSMPADVMQAIGSLKGALEGRIDELVWGSHLKRVPQAVSLFQALMGFGFSTALLRAMLKRLPEHLAAGPAFQWARQELVKHLPVQASEEELWRPGLALAVVGPTGVGKTTTLAKLAARAVRRFGPQGVVLVTTDTYRIGAHEQLKIYGQILRVPVHVVQDAEQLAQVVRGTGPDSVILIDNVGISQRDRYVAEQAAMLASAGRDVRRLLVLNAASHGDTLDEVARTYRNDGGTPLAGCIITKLDEAARLGAVLDTCIRYQLPVHYVSDGQKVPENLHFLSALDLVDRALADASAASALYAPTGADLAALMSVERSSASRPDVAARAGRQRLLSGFLAGGLGSAGAAGDQVLQRVCDYLDSQPACRQAFEAWQAFRDGAAAAPGNGAAARHAYKTIQVEMRQAGRGDEGIVLSHADFNVGGRQGRGRMSASLAYGLSQGVLGSPLQQVRFASGWQSSNGFAGIEPLTSSQALLEDIDWYQAQQSQFPVLHLFDGGTQALWRQLQEHADVLWGAQCPAGARFVHEETVTTAGALAKACGYHPVGRHDAEFTLSGMAGGSARALWVGMQEVGLSSRRAAAQDLRLHHMRLQREDGGGAGATQLASVLAPADVAPGMLARAVLMRQEQRWVLRAMPAFWEVFARTRQESGPLDRAYLSAAMGAAAWQLLHGPESSAARQVLALPEEKAWTVAQVAEGMLRLFAVKALMG